MLRNQKRILLWKALKMLSGEGNHLQNKEVNKPKNKLGEN